MVDPHIAYPMAFMEWEAGVWAGLDMWKWEQGIYPHWFKVQTIATYTLHRLVENHVEDARAQKMEREARRKR